MRSSERPMTNQIDNCPCCNSESAIDTQWEYASGDIEVDYILCPSCGLNMQLGDKGEYTEKTKAETIKAWNTRQEARELVWLPAGRNYTATRSIGGRYQLTHMYNERSWAKGSDGIYAHTTRGE